MSLFSFYLVFVFSIFLVGFGCKKESTSKITSKSKPDPNTIAPKPVKVLMTWICGNKQEKFVYVLCGQPKKPYNNLWISGNGFDPSLPDSFIFRADSTAEIKAIGGAGFDGKCRYTLNATDLWLYDIRATMHYNNMKAAIDSVHYSGCLPS